MGARGFQKNGVQGARGLQKNANGVQGATHNYSVGFVIHKECLRPTRVALMSLG